MRGIRATSLRLALALSLSFTLWTFVSVTENPEERVPFEEIYVKVRNLASHLVMVDQYGLPNEALPPIKLTIETDQATQNKLRPADFQAFIDLSTFTEPGERRIPINTEKTRPDINFMVIDIAPEMLLVRVEQLITNTIPLTVNIQGNPPFGFEYRPPTVHSNGSTITSVHVQGPQSRVERVTEARVTANIDQRSASYSSSINLEAIDATGQVVEGVKLQPSTVNVRIPILSSVGLKRVPILGSITGAPAPGYTVIDIQSVPPLITLAGSSNPLDKVENINTAPVDISGATKTMIQSVSLQLPVNTSLQSGEPTAITVTVHIEPLVRPFQVQLPFSVQVQGAPRGIQLTVDPDIIQIPLTGTTNDINRLNTTSLIAVVDVSNLAPGVHVLTPQLTLPEGISVVGDIPSVTITLRLTTTTPTSTAPSAPIPLNTPEPTGDLSRPKTPTSETTPSPEKTAPIVVTLLPTTPPLTPTVQIDTPTPATTTPDQ